MPSLYGYQVQRNVMPEWLLWDIIASGCKYLKFLNPEGFGDRPVPEGLITIGRLHFGEGEPDKELIWQGAVGADVWFEWAHPRILLSPWIDIWEGPNEPYISNEEQAHAMVAFERRRVELVHGMGKQTASLCIGTGNPPDMRMWNILGEALWETDYLELHQYGMKYMHLEPGHLLRHREAFEILRNAGYRIPKTIIGETGVDYEGDPYKDGWIAQGYSEQQYLDQLVPYDKELRRYDPKIVCLLIFITMDDKWPSFRMTRGMTKKLTEYMTMENGQSDEPTNETLGQTMVKEAKHHTITIITGHAFYKKGRELGLEPRGDEFNVNHGNNYLTRGQAWADPNTNEIYVLWTEIGNWGDIKVETTVE